MLFILSFALILHLDLFSSDGADDGWIWLVWNTGRLFISVWKSKSITYLPRIFAFMDWLKIIRIMRVMLAMLPYRVSSSLSLPLSFFCLLSFLFSVIFFYTQAERQRSHIAFPFFLSFFEKKLHHCIWNDTLLLLYSNVYIYTHTHMILLILWCQIYTF